MEISQDYSAYGELIVEEYTAMQHNIKMSPKVVSLDVDFTMLRFLPHPDVNGEFQVRRCCCLGIICICFCLEKY